jgi:hypothetical protein
MKKVVRYVSRLLDSQNRQLLSQYLGALHGRLEHEWLPGDSRATDVVFVQTRHQLNDLPDGAKPIAFMPREGSSVGEQAAVIDRPHLIQTFARNLNRSAGEALVTPHSSSANASSDVDYIASAWERAANSSAWPEYMDSVAASKQTENIPSVPQAVVVSSDNVKPAATHFTLNTPGYTELRRPLTPLTDYSAGLVSAFTSAVECVEHARRMAWPLVAIVAPQGWRVFIDTEADRVYSRNAASKPFSGHARFLSVLRGACQVMPLSKSTFAEETKQSESQSYQRFAWELGIAQSERLLPWLPNDGLLSVNVDLIPNGITLNEAHKQALNALSRGAVAIRDLERLRAPRHALMGLVNALELTRALSVTGYSSATLKAPPAPPIFLRVPHTA